VVIVGSFPIEVERQPFYEKELDLLISCSIGPGRYDYRYEHDGIDYPYPYVRWTERRNMEAFLSLVESGSVNLKPFTSHNFEIQEAEAAYETMMNDPDIISVILSYAQVPSHRKKAIVRLKDALVRSGRIRVGVIGTGNFARGYHLPNLRSQSNLYTISAICTRSGHIAKYISENYTTEYCTTDYHEICKDKSIDMVLISTRHDSHAKIVIDAARAKKHVFVEKPAAISSRELHDLIKAVKESEVHFMVGFNRRYSSATKKLKEILDRLPGRTVASYHINAGPLPEDHWVKRVNESGGRIVGECVHFVDLLRFLIASPIVDSYSVVPSGKEKYENLSGGILFEDGSIASITYGNVGPSKGPREIIEIQKGGSFVRVEDFNKIQCMGDINMSWKGIRQDKGYLEEIKLFGMEIKGKIPTLMTLDEIEEVHMATFKMAGIS
jgi:predicted dehydrogenase